MPQEIQGLFNPEAILNQLKLRQDIKAADFGCGAGFFSLALAKQIPQGKVYALDVVKESLEVVESKSKLEGVSNIETIHCNLEILGGSKLADNFIDLVMMRNILFQSQKKSEIIKEARRVLKPGGELVFIEWANESPLAPKEGWFISKEQARSLVEAEWFVFEKELAVDSHHYGLIFKK